MPLVADEGRAPRNRTHYMGLRSLIWGFSITLAVLAMCLGGTSNRTQRNPTSERVCAPLGSLVAVADLHGDIDKAKTALQLLCLVDWDGNWIAKGITAVQLGDLVDRGPSSLELVKYMHHLQDQALQHNSSLILLIGNHELFNLRGDFRYVAPEEIIQLGQQHNADDLSSVSGSSTSRSSSAASAQSYTKGLDVWASLWQLTDPTAAAAAAAVGGMPSPPQELPSGSTAAAAGGGSSGTGGAAAGYTAAANGAAAVGGSGGNNGDSGVGGSAVGSLRRSIADHHQLIAVHGQGGPCATAFVHAGLLPNVLQELLSITNSSRQDSSTPANHNSSSSSSDSVVPDAQVHSKHPAPSRTHHRPGVVNQQQRQQQQHDVDVRVVTLEQLQQINHMFKKAVQSCDDTHCIGSSSSSDEAAVHHLWSAAWSQHSPLWTRHQAMGPEARVCEQLNQVLWRLNVRRLIVGHTPQDGGRATSRCGGKLLLLDTGMSIGMMGSPAAAWICHSVTDDVISNSRVGGEADVNEGSASDATGSRSMEAGDQQGAGKQQYKAAWSAVVYADGVVQTM